MPDILNVSPMTAMVAGIVAVLGWLFGSYQHRSKAKVDESSLILGKWKELVDTHQEDIKYLKEEFAAYRKRADDEIDALRKRLKDVEDEFAAFRKESDKRVRERDQEIVSLKRQLSQISQSTAVQLGRRGGVPKPEDSEAVEKLDRAGHNSNGDGK